MEHDALVDQFRADALDLVRSLQRPCSQDAQIAVEEGYHRADTGAIGVSVGRIFGDRADHRQTAVEIGCVRDRIRHAIDIAQVEQVDAGLRRRRNPRRQSFFQNR